ncbi:MAG: heme ABC transporter ATP-binding protein [SAR86 cluster bacterium]|uniref:Heme ABC transporter ATP-binding protein n=1 Tax=SAR86 cluster bacterium TaxID=2030880 RepID=A0A2A4MHF8_9GAMM|nr:MAG: heme ABC transporter ATP-binding protein [SAR86 cluster bacterium]
MSQNRVVLNLSNVSLRLAQKQILQGINVTINAGELVVIIGPNGAGKSSLIKVATGELPSSAGAVTFQSKAFNEIDALEKARHMAVLPQQSLLDFGFRSKEVVALGRTPHQSGAQVDAQIVRSALEKMDVYHLSNRIYTSLSGGEKQRVQLARVLAQVWEAQSLIVLDEPTAALDYAHQRQIMQVLKKKSQSGGAVLMAMHDINLAASFADKIIMMCEGRVVAIGGVDEVLQEDVLEKVFDIKFHRIMHPDTGKFVFVS